ncbi:trafficking protein particle complex subunit 5, partial [Diaporthe helianthi]
MSGIPTHKTAASKDALAPPGSGLRYPTSGKTIYHRPLNRSRTSELSQASFAYLFAEMISYAQRRVTGIQDLEK